MSRKKNNKRKGKGKRSNDFCCKLNREYPKNVSGLFIRAQLKYNQGDPQGAVLDLDEYLSTFLDNLKALIFRAVILYYLCEYQGAIKDLSEAVLINPDFMDVYLIRGDVYRALGKLDESLDDFNRVIQSSPDEAMAYIGRGDTKMLQHDTAGAKSDYARAIAINPSLITYCPEIGTVSEQETGSFDDQSSQSLKNVSAINNSSSSVSKIILVRRQLIHFYDWLKVKVNSSLNCAILILVIPFNELLADSVIAALIET